MSLDSSSRLRAEFSQQPLRFSLATTGVRSSPSTLAICGQARGLRSTFGTAAANDFGVKAVRARRLAAVAQSPRHARRARDQGLRRKVMSCPWSGEFVRRRAFRRWRRLLLYPTRPIGHPSVAARGPCGIFVTRCSAARQRRCRYRRARRAFIFAAEDRR
jgi:hypothetical protein